MPGEWFDYSNERQRHEQFVGRTGLLARLDQLLLEDDSDRWVMVTGGPGMGKSALLAAWLARCEAAGVAVPHHFIRRGEYDWDDPAKLVSSLVAQICERFPGLEDPDAGTRMHPALRLANTLSRISKTELRPRGQRMVVLIDGLDEYDPPAGSSAGDPLAAFLPHALPSGVSVVCASRPRHPYVSSLEMRDGELVQIDLDDPRSAADNDATVRAFWERAAVPLGLEIRFIDEAVARARGNIQHAVQLRKHLTVLPVEHRRVEDIPRGLAALLQRSWERIAADPVVVDGLGILCAAREALTLDELGTVAAWSGDAPRRAFVRGAKELLVETRRPRGQLEYRLHHDSIRGHIAEALGEVALRQCHRALALRLANWPASVAGEARRYALRHALMHRAETGDWADAWRLAADMSFLEVSCRELGVHETESNVARIAERCYASGNSVLGRRFGDLARVLVRESHWLRTAPGAIAALVWNRLRRSGWSAEDINQHVSVPEGVTSLRLRHMAARESPALLRDLIGHADRVVACAVTADGQRAISASGDNTLRVWDLESGLTLATLEGHTDAVLTCALTADGRYLVSGSWDQTLRVWDLESARSIATLNGHTSPVRACATTADGRGMVSASWDEPARIWNLQTRHTLTTLKGDVGSVLAFAITADGRRVVSASSDRTLKIWDLETGRSLATLQGHANAVTACAVTSDGRRVISASNDWTLKVWDLETERLLATLQGHTDKVNACAVTADGRHVVSASSDRTLKVWDLENGHQLATLEGHASAVTACVVTSDGGRVVSGSNDHTLKVWDLKSQSEAAASEGHTGWVSACVVTADGRHAVTASSDRTLSIWNLERSSMLVALRGHTREVTSCSVTMDGRRVISASMDQTLNVWDVESGRTLSVLKGHSDSVYACAVTVDGQRVVSASGDLTLKVWSLQSECALATLRGHRKAVTACSVTADGRRVVSASADRTLKVWDLDSGRTLTTLKGHQDCVTACVLTPEGRHVVSASHDQTLKVWDLESGYLLATLKGHAGAVIACAITQDGRHVVSASRDRTLRVWDLQTHVCLLTHYGDAPYRAVAAAATVIVAGDDAGAVWFLDCPPGPVGPVEGNPMPPPNTQGGLFVDRMKGGSTARATAEPSRHVEPEPLQKHMSSTPRVDVGILTIRDDEFRAVLDVFPRKIGVFKGSKREYTIRYADDKDSDCYTVAILRQLEQGTGEALDAARDLIDDLSPKLVLVVGIAGGLPSDEVRLGDVVLATRIHDFTIEARRTGQKTAYAATGGPIDKALAAAVANLAGREDELGNWTIGLSLPPAVNWTRKGQLYGPADWQRTLRAKLEHHHGRYATSRPPVYIAGPIASSDRLVKDPKLLFPWITTARNILAVEMESGGVFRAARERAPMLAIRGISDLVGLKRSEAWTKFACASAAAFTRAFLRTRPV